MVALWGWGGRHGGGMGDMGVGAGVSLRVRFAAQEEGDPRVHTLVVHTLVTRAWCVHTLVVRARCVCGGGGLVEQTAQEARDAGAARHVLVALLLPRRCTIVLWLVQWWPVWWPVWWSVVDGLLVAAVVVGWWVGGDGQWAVDSGRWAVVGAAHIRRMGRVRGWVGGWVMMGGGWWVVGGGCARRQHLTASRTGTA